jgi:hypothetical protein
VSIANFIKQRPLKSRIFAKLCESMHKKPRDSFNTQKFDGVQEEKYRYFLSSAGITAFIQI